MEYLQILKQMRDDYAQKLDALEQAINQLMAEEFASKMRKTANKEDDKTDDIPPTIKMYKGKKGGIRL